MQTYRTQLIYVLATLLIGCTQVFGVHQRYICEDNGAAVETPAEHCHRLASNDRKYAPCEESRPSKCAEKGPKRQHAPVALNTEALQTGVVSIPSTHFIAIPLIEIGFCQKSWTKRTPKEEATPVNWHIQDNASTPASLQVARCVVILI